MNTTVYGIQTTRDIKLGNDVCPNGSLLKNTVWLTPATNASEVWSKTKTTPVKRLVTEINNRLTEPGVKLVTLTISVEVAG